MLFDFTINPNTNYVSKVGYYSRCEPHEATREEAILWQHICTLEKIIEQKHPPDVKALLEKLRAVPHPIIKVKMNAWDFAEMRRYAFDQFEFEEQPAFVRRHIFAHFPLLRDDELASLDIIVDRDVKPGNIEPVEVVPSA